MYKTLQQERMMEKRKHVTLYFDLGLSNADGLCQL